MFHEHDRFSDERYSDPVTGGYVPTENQTPTLFDNVLYRKPGMSKSKLYKILGGLTALSMAVFPKCINPPAAGDQKSALSAPASDSQSESERSGSNSIIRLPGAYIPVAAKLTEFECDPNNYPLVAREPVTFELDGNVEILLTEDKVIFNGTDYIPDTTVQQGKGVEIVLADPQGTFKIGFCNEKDGYTTPNGEYEGQWYKGSVSYQQSLIIYLSGR